MNEPKRFTLFDASGVEHDYVLTLHLASDGTRVAMRLMGLLSGPVTQALTTLFSQGGLVERVAEKGLDGITNEEVVGVFAGIDSAALSKSLASALGDPSTVDLVSSLIAHAHRDGKALSIRTEFDRAFSGNYAELFRLCWEVVKANRFLSL